MTGLTTITAIQQLTECACFLEASGVDNYVAQIVHRLTVSASKGNYSLVIAAPSETEDIGDLFIYLQQNKFKFTYANEYVTIDWSNDD